jgi:hypothetical protein
MAARLDKTDSTDTPQVAAVQYWGDRIVATANGK